MYPGLPITAPGAVSRSRAGELPGGSVTASLYRPSMPGHAEIGDAHATVLAHQNVVGLEVAVDDPGAVRGG